MSSEQNLKKVLGFKEVLSIAMGQTIGSGVMAMTGIAIGMTGRGVVLAYILSSVFVVFMSIPTMMMGSALPTTGGAYRYASRLGRPVAGLVYMLIYLAYNITLALFALSFADYMQSLIPGVPFKLCAAGILTLMYVTNLFGMQWAAKLQNLMVVVMIIAFAVFIGNGMPQVDFSAFSSMEQLAPNGFVTLITTAGLLTFATGGANVVASLGSEMKNPGRDIPLGMAVGTLAVGVIYAFMALIASGVLPVEQVANQNLSVVAREILSKPLFVFFIVGGAMFAIATTLNSTMSWVTKPVMAACADGWFPKGLAAVNEKVRHASQSADHLLLCGPDPDSAGYPAWYAGHAGFGHLPFHGFDPDDKQLLAPQEVSGSRGQGALPSEARHGEGHHHRRLDPVCDSKRAAVQHPVDRGNHSCDALCRRGAGHFDRRV